MAEVEDFLEQLIIHDGDNENSDEDEHVLQLNPELDQTHEEIPSEIIDKDYIYKPRSFENFEEREEWKDSGKWLVFSHGNIEKQDFWWTHLQPLVADGTLICVKSSTATDLVNGVIMCYTSNSQDMASVKRAADAIRNVTNFEYLMYYKTNEATDSGRYQMHGDTQITKYMHSVACSLYDRDRNKRWQKVTFE